MKVILGTEEFEKERRSYQRGSLDREAITSAVVGILTLDCNRVVVICW